VIDLDDFAHPVNLRAEQWRNSGVQWRLHRGPTRDKSAAWVHCSTDDRKATLTIWTSGEAELDAIDMSTGVARSTSTKCSLSVTSSVS
jgi:hypothetical protein